MKYDVTGIGNPLLDLTLEVEEELLGELGLKKGSMQLIDANQAKKINTKIKGYEVKTTPGGGAANVLAGISSMGGKTILLGKIGSDQYGQTYSSETKRIGTIPKLNKHESAKTGYAITFITPDGERTFATHLGAALHFNIKDIDKDAIKQSKILHIDSYKIEDCKLKNTINYALNIAKKNQTKVSVDLSDGELVKRNLKYLREFVKNNVDIIFANETEAEVFTGQKELAALNQLSKICDIAVVKLGEKGSLIKNNRRVYRVPVCKVKVKNTNGAGDAYAAGILYGLTNGIPMEKIGPMASRFASLVVTKESARIN